MYETSKRLFIVLFVGVILFVGIMFFDEQNIVYESDEQVLEYYNDGWKDVTDSEEFVYFSVLNDKDSIVKRQISNVLPLNLHDGSAISFFSKHQYIEVYVEGELIYSFSPSKGNKYRVPENLWHFIGLKEKFSQKEITISFYGTNSITKEEIPPMLIGDKAKLIKNNLVKNGFAFIMSLAFAGVGLVICVIWFFYRKQVGMGKELLYIGAIMVGTAIWSGIQTQVLQILIGHSYELTIFLYFMILLIQFFMLRFAILKFSVLNQRIFEKILYVYIGVVLFSVISYAVGIIGIKEMGIIAQAFTVVCVFIMFILMCIGLKRAEKAEKRVILGHLVGVVLVLFLLCIDFIRFYYYGNWDIIGMGRWAVFMYILVLAYQAIAESMGLMQLGRESEKMKNIAYSDALTCMGNRSAFMDMVSQINPQEYKEYGIAMFDLNNLKTFNDIHGHSAGDYYLIISSEIIRDIFGEQGKIYRIGGDEFCAVLKNFSQDEFQESAKEMHLRLKELKGPYTKEQMSIAYGYQTYNKLLDSDLSATMERADSSMYCNKKLIKQRIN